MRIGIDARFYGPRVGGGGIGRYVAELITHLQKIDKKNSYILFLKKENFHECKITNPRFEKRLVDVHWYGIKEQLRMPKEIKRSRVDFMHFPHWNVPIFCPVPFVVTIHDLILLQDRLSARSSSNNPILHGFKYAGFRSVLENAIHRSKRIITVSGESKSQILKHFNISEKKVTVIHNGLTPPKKEQDINLTALGIYEPYFLYVGNAYPHKNLNILLEAFTEFQKENKFVQLVIAGKRDIFSHELEKTARTLGINSESIRFVNLPSDSELACLYKKASLFVYPSRLEGFGIPPLEAMHFKTPVAASNASSIPEILHTSALYFDPDDSKNLVQYMNRAINQPESLAPLIKAGLARTKQFSWDEHTQKTLEIYNTLHLRHA